MHTDPPIRMTVHRVWPVLYSVLFVISFVMFVLLLVKGEAFAIFLLIFCMVVKFLIMMSRTYVEADDERIFVNFPPFGKYAIRWDEIRTVETNGIGYVLRGEGKALGFNTAMGSSSAEGLKEYMAKQIAARGIEIKQVKFMPRVKPVNTKVG